MFTVEDMKKEYIKSINDLMDRCEDVALLSLINMLLSKSEKKGEGNK